MPDSATRILFLPVSGPYGMGEFARCSAIARAVLERWPAVAVHFVLSRAAPYAQGAPFPKTLIDASPTLATRPVIELLRSWRPSVVVFDNAGRTAQLAAAHALGSRIVFISARARQRRKAFRLRWMRLIDEHWIAYPKFIAGDLTVLERLKLDLMRRPAVRYLDVILSRPAAVIATDGTMRGGAYVLVIPGGGTGHPGAEDATRVFASAARQLAADGFEVRFVGPVAGLPAGEATGANFHALGALPQSDLALQMRQARLVVTNGGSTLLQSLASGAACVAAPIAGDQRARIRRCVARGAAVETELSADAIAAAALTLLRDARAREAVALRAQALSLEDGVEIALRALGRLIEEPSSSAA